MREKIVGILGGMGPEATADLFSKIILETKATKEEEHLRIIIDNNPKMPSRQDAILKNGESPVPAMIQTSKNLKNAGADFIIIGANTAHYFYDDIKKEIDIPILHIIDEAIKDLLKNYPNIKKVGVMATNAAVSTGLYKKCCERFGIDVIENKDKLQQQIHDSIFKFKYEGLTKNILNLASNSIQELIDEGAEAVIMGCTEIPIILKDKEFKIPIIDPNEVIAKVAVAYAKNRYDFED